MSTEIEKETVCYRVKHTKKGEYLREGYFYDEWVSKENADLFSSDNQAKSAIASIKKRSNVVIFSELEIEKCVVIPEEEYKEFMKYKGNLG